MFISKHINPHFNINSKGKKSPKLTVNKAYAIVKKQKNVDNG